MTVKCQNCGARYRVAWFPVEQTNKTNKQAFQSTMPHFRGGLLGEVQSLLWHLKGNRYIPPDKKFVVRTETKTSKHQILINEYEIPVKSESELRELAYVYITKGKSWSRDNTVENSSLTQTKHNKIKDAFLRLNFLDKIDDTHYALNDAGYRFLKHFANKQ